LENPSPPRKRGRPPKKRDPNITFVTEAGWDVPDPFKQKMEAEGITFPEAVEKLAANIPQPRKIAIVGSYPEHWESAPFSDSSWEIWTFSAGMVGKHPRFDKWFELHPERTYPKYEGIHKGYIKFIEDKITQKNFPAKELLKEFGPYFFSTGQVTWMLAYAITQNPDTIGIWGVEANGEYTPQRKDIHYFIQVARDRGIKIVVPDNCTLLAKPKLYAFASLGT